MIRTAKTSLLKFFAVAAAILAMAMAVGCPKETAPGAEPILRDSYSFYIIDPGPWQNMGPQEPTQKEFLVLKDGETELHCGIYPGANITSGSVESEIATFARETILSDNWLPGCFRWQLDAAEVNVDERWFYYVTLLVRRNPERTAGLSRFQQAVHAAELARYPDHVDMIVRLYYTLVGSNIYILTLSGPPEELVTKEKDVINLLANIRFSATDLLSEVGAG